MSAALDRLARGIGIEPDESRIFTWAAATFFLVHAGSVALANASDTYFLKRIGVQLLPVAFLVSSLLLVVTTWAMVRLAAQRPQIRLLARTLLVLAGGLLPLWLLVRADVRIVFAILMIVSKQVESVAVLVFWVALGGLLHARQAKRLYAPIVAGGTLGEIVGSFASGSVGHTFGISTLLPFAAGALALAGVLALRVRSLAPVRFGRSHRRRAVDDTPGLFALLLPLWRDSRLFRILAVSALLCGALGPMLYFQFAYIADLSTTGVNGELRLLKLYAAFRGWLSVLVLLLQLLGTSRIFLRLGVPLASTLSPVVYLAGFIGVSVRVGLDAAIGAMAGANLQDHAVYDPAQRVLVTLFPERQRPAATSLIQGPVQRAGGVLGNLIVLATIAIGTPAAVALVGVPIAALWAAVALILWRIYPTLLLEVATTRDLHIEEGMPLGELVDPATQRALLASLTMDDPDRVRTACHLVAAVPLPRAATTLARAARRAPPANRPLLLETLHRMLDVNGGTPAIVPAAARQLETLLANPEVLSDDERTGLVAAYARLAADVRRGSHAADLLERFRTDPAEAVRLAATVRLSRAGVLAERGDLDAVIMAALHSDDPATRHIALDELRTSLLTPGAGPTGNGASARWAACVDAVAARLGQPDDRARAAEILADIGARYGGQAVPAEVLLAHRADDDPRVRAAVLRFVGSARLEGYIAWAIERLAADDESEALAAANALRAFGRAAIYPLIDGLQRGRRAIRLAVLPILRDLQVDVGTLRGLIERQIEQIQRVRSWLRALDIDEVSDLVKQRLRERADERAQTMLLLLATLTNDDRYAILGRLLARSPHGRGRAVLLEALEALLPPDERLRLIPLLDDDGAMMARQPAAAVLGRDPLSFTDAVSEILTEGDPLTVSFLTASLDPRRLAARRNGEDTAAGETAEPTEMMSRVDICLHLRNLDLFAGLTIRQLSEIATVVHEEVYPIGAAIVREGEFGDCMYLIVSGGVEISREGQYKVNSGPGELFGEMSLFDGETRMATVTAARRTRLLRLDRPALFELMDEQPAIAIGICQTLSRHVRDSIKRLEERHREKAEPSTLDQGDDQS